jgi:hypothetical protein
MALANKLTREQILLVYVAMAKSAQEHHSSAAEDIAEVAEAHR